jgi:hypothetical protein
MGVSTDLREDTGGANTFISVVLVAVVLVLAGTVWMFLLDDSAPTEAPNTAFDTELDEERLVLEHTNGDTISPGDTDYIGITGNENITIDWNDNVTNSTAKPSKREAVVTDSITAGTEIAVVSNASTADSLRFVWFAVDGTGYTLLSDITPPDGGGVDAGENSTSSVGGSLGRTVTAGIE